LAIGEMLLTTFIVMCLLSNQIMEELRFFDRVSRITDFWEAPCLDWPMGTILHFADSRTFQKKI
jgi:hypothetical protein